MDYAPPPGDPRPNILLYGPNKVGKTAGACSAPGDVLLFNCDLPNATRYARRREGDRVREILLPPFVEGRRPILEIMLEIQVETMAGTSFADVVVVDPISELYRRLLDEVSNKAMKPSFDHRLAVTVYIERFCRMLCEAPPASVFVCHELLVKDEATESFERLPHTGTTNTNLGTKLMGMVDIIGYCGVSRQEGGAKEYGAQLFPGDGRRGGDRFDVLGDYQPLDLVYWWELIAAQKVVSTEPEPAVA
jgi:hypothetical protein